MTCIVDASVAVKWVVPEVLSDNAQRLLAGDEELLAPDLLQVEAANALWKKAVRKEISPREADTALGLLLASGIVLHPTGPLLVRAMGLARRLRHPVYECVYLALAEQERVRFVTADDRMADRVRTGRLRIPVIPLRSV